MIQKTLKINDKPYYLYLENGEYKMTTKENFNARIQDARQIITLQGFTNANDCIKYLQKYYTIKVL